MGLFGSSKSKVFHKDSCIRAQAVEKLDSHRHQALLAQVATRDTDFLVRSLAVQKLDTDQNQPLLADIAIKDQSSIVQSCAVTRLKSVEYHDLIADMAKKDDFIEVKQHAIRTLKQAKWKSLVNQLKEEISGKVCISCQKALITEKDGIPKIIPFVKEGLLKSPEAKREAEKAEGKIRYKCAKCGLIYCYSCASTKACAKCRSNKFARALEG